MVKYLLLLYKKLTITRAPCCRYYPSCSEYMEGAISKHGFIKGLFLGAKRIIKCNQFFKGGYDPIP